MHHHDTLYGSSEITQPVLVALCRSEAMQRLHGVLQHGISGVIGLTPPITRFEHSVGTCLLVRRLGATLPEQIAALLHDVSHTAFSHVIDYVFHGHDSQSYHEDVKEAYVHQTDIPQLLARYGYDWREFMHEEPYTLLEQPAPRLCADRLDYFLRDSIGLGLARQGDIDETLQHLATHHGRIVTDSLAIARWLAYTYIEADKRSWANFREVALYELTARAIRRALEIRVISNEDFWKTDVELWRMLHSSTDRVVQGYLELVSTETQFAWDAENPAFWVSTKLRSIDPEVLVGQEAVPLSTIDPEFGAYRLQYHAQREGAWPVRVVEGKG